MLKVFLVEDDTAIRESIRKNVKWETHGYELVGQAGDGEIAYAKIKETMPDIIITDLKMPFMDGMELSRIVRKEMPAIKIIVLTGYNDFEKVQEALQLGISEYLLKPITPEALVETLDRVKSIIEAEREHSQFLSQYRLEMEEIRDAKLRRFFENWISGEKKVYELLDIASQFGMSLSAQNYVVIRFQLFAESEIETYSEALEAKYGHLEKMLLEDKRLLLFKQGLQGWAFIVKGDEKQSASAITKEICKQMENTLENEEAMRYIIAVGSEVVRLLDIAKSYNSASRAYAYHYIIGHSAVVYADLLERETAARTDETVDLNTMDATKIDKSIVERFLRSGSVNSAEALVDDLFAGIGEHYLQSFMLRQYLLMDINFTVSVFLQNIGADKSAASEKFGDLEELASEIASVDGARRYLIDLLENTLKIRDSSSRKRYDSSIIRAQGYISDNFNDTDISLNRVAKYVNLSPAHFSSIFSQETGQTFTERLTSIRIDKAKELLLCSAMRSSEIAYEVGYKDPHYFSYLFKKVNGCSPREFRTNREEVS